MAGRYPAFNRFYLGGEQDVRGFNFLHYLSFCFDSVFDQYEHHLLRSQKARANRSPTPQQLTCRFWNSSHSSGRDYQNVLNLEYRIPIAGPVTLVMFNDVGVNGICGQIAIVTKIRAAVACSRTVSQS